MNEQTTYTYIEQNNTCPLSMLDIKYGGISRCKAGQVEKP